MNEAREITGTQRVGFRKASEVNVEHVAVRKKNTMGENPWGTLRRTKKLDRYRYQKKTAK
jgi:hypothetical protein